MIAEIRKLAYDIMKNAALHGKNSALINGKRLQNRQQHCIKQQLEAYYLRTASSSTAQKVTCRPSCYSTAKLPVAFSTLLCGIFPVSITKITFVIRVVSNDSIRVTYVLYDTERRGKAWKDAARFKMILEVVLASTDFATTKKLLCLTIQST